MEFLKISLLLFPIVQVRASDLVIQTSGVPVCQPGTYRKNSKCIPCPKGTYQEKKGQLTCDKCPGGSFSNETGMIFSWFCKSCPVNYFSEDGASECTPCPSGTLGTVFNTCITCPPGSYYLNSFCENCYSSTVSTKPNQLFCEDCPSGFKPTPGRDNCTKEDCPPGQIYVAYLFSCQPLENDFRCSPGLYYFSSSRKECERCPLRSIPNKKRNKCIRCPPGTFLYDTNDIFFSCQKCRNGSITHGPSKAACRNVDGSCPMNSFIDADGDCDRCFPNEFRDLKLNRCTPCPPHMWSRGGTVTKCSVCQPGQDPYFPNYWTTSPCTCPTGYVNREGKCVKCPSGTKPSNDGRCSRCLSSEYSLTGDAACRKCPAGTSSYRTGGESCQPLPVCPDGYVLPPTFHEDLALDECISRKSGCPKGAKNIAKSFSERPHCVRADGSRICAPGYIYDGVKDCITCFAGNYLSKSTKRLECKSCPDGTYSLDGLPRRCSKCPPGFGSDFIGCCTCGKRINNKGDCVPRKGEPGEGELEVIEGTTVCTE